jgi:GntR family transcriptional regulator/MocR family aminotransferase
LLQQQHPKLIYTIPNFQNPTGACLSLPRRRQLIALADRYNIPILEDDFVGDLRYEGRAQPALKALDPGGRVIYVGTFSKMIMPGLRVGFLVAEGPIFELLGQLKRVSDLMTSTLTQRALEVYVTVGRYQAHVRRSCQVYRRRRDAIVQAISCYLPAGAQVLAPQGGLFVWLRLPEGASALRLLPLAAEEGVEYAPGPRFFPHPPEGEPYIRLNFATQTPEDIDQGIRRLGRALQRLRERAAG